MMLLHCGFWGLFATIVLTTLLAASQGLGFTRMNMPFLLGTIFTANRDRAKVYGVGLHFLLGIVLAWLYLITFQIWDGATWWKGLILGGLHACFLLTLGVTLLPGIHPRMASEQQGPTALKQLEPPGFLGMHYGNRTPVSVLIGHLIFGLILGIFLPHH